MLKSSSDIFLNFVANCSRLIEPVYSSEGKVLNGALIQSSGHPPADQKAIDIALRDISFGKSTNDVVVGDLVFYWHTDPVSVTNIVEQLR